MKSVWEVISLGKPLQCLSGQQSGDCGTLFFPPSLFYFLNNGFFFFLPVSFVLFEFNFCLRTAKPGLGDSGKELPVSQA